MALVMPVIPTILRRHDDGSDNRPLIANADQLDTDSDGTGDACDIDDDDDGTDDGPDNCPLIANADQPMLTQRHW